MQTRFQREIPRVFVCKDRRLAACTVRSIAFVFFASGVDSSYITGDVLTLLGGETTAA